MPQYLCNVRTINLTLQSKYEDFNNDVVKFLLNSLQNY